MMSLNKSEKNCFSVVFDPSDSYENRPDENVYKESILAAASSPCINA